MLPVSPNMFLVVVVQIVLKSFTAETIMYVLSGTPTNFRTLQVCIGLLMD